jgi:hypothetical protein
LGILFTNKFFQAKTTLGNIKRDIEKRIISFGIINESTLSHGVNIIVTPSAVKHIKLKVLFKNRSIYSTPYSLF